MFQNVHKVCVTLCRPPLECHALFEWPFKHKNELIGKPLWRSQKLVMGVQIYIFAQKVSLNIKILYIKFENSILSCA